MISGCDCSSIQHVHLSYPSYYHDFMCVQLCIYPYFRTNCSFRNYVPNNEKHAYRCYTSGIVSECPDYFADWKLNQDCTQGQVSWVYHGSKVYRNAFCAICNLGDEIVNTDVFQYDQNWWYGYVYTKATTPIKRTLAAITLDLSNNRCCWDVEGCVENTRGTSSDSPWGSIAGRNSRDCVRVPFTSQCSNPDPDNLGPTNTSFTYLYSAKWTPRENNIVRIPIPSVQTAFIVQAPSFSRLAFTDFGELPLEQSLTINTNWTEITETLQICSNGSFITASGDKQYLNLRLSPSLVEVSYYHYWSY